MLREHVFDWVGEHADAWENDRDATQAISQQFSASDDRMTAWAAWKTPPEHRALVFSVLCAIEEFHNKLEEGRAIRDEMTRFVASVKPRLLEKYAGRPVDDALCSDIAADVLGLLRERFPGQPLPAHISVEEIGTQMVKMKVRFEWTD